VSLLFKSNIYIPPHLYRYLYLRTINMPAQEIQQPQAQQMELPTTQSPGVVEQPVSLAKATHTVIFVLTNP
jgi:hypothetical protein